MPNCYTVYMHTSPSGKVYIGITKRNPMERWRNGGGYGHSPHFNAAIEKYGWAAFKHEILAQGLSQAEAEKLEVELIKARNATDPRYGYNTDKGGSTGPKHTEQTRKKIGDANRSRFWTDEAREKLRVYATGRHPSDEAREHMRQAQRGRKHTPETIEKLRLAKNCRPVKNLTTGKIYASVNQAARDCRTDPSGIVAVCKNRNGRRIAGGYAWAYEGVAP